MSDDLESFRPLVNVQVADDLVARLLGKQSLSALAGIMRDKGKSGKMVFLLEFAGDLSLSRLAEGPVTMVEGNTYSMATDGTADIISRGVMGGHEVVERFSPLGPLYIGDNVLDEVFDMPLDGELIVRVLFVTP